jgi:hypothetical protein
MIRMDLGFKVDVKITAPFGDVSGWSSEKPIHLGKQEGGTVPAATPQCVA